MTLNFNLLLIFPLGGESEDDFSNNVYALSPDGSAWEAREEMVSGVSETSIHSNYAVLNIDIDS